MPLWYVGIQEASLIEGDTVAVGAKVRGLGTRLTQRVVAEPEGFFKLAMPVMTGQMRRNLEISLQNLKEIIEAR